MMNRNASTFGAIIFGIAALFSGTGSTTPPKTLATPSTPPAVHPSTTPHGFINPHLHLSPAETPEKTLKKPAALAHKPWTNWDARTTSPPIAVWGAVTGVVHNNAGEPIDGARVALRKPRGRIFASVALRHSVYTHADGTYVMEGVRPGDYRVYAFVGKKSGYDKKTVEPQTVTTANIKV